MTITEQDIASLASMRTIDFTTIGRRSGRPRTVEIWWFHHDGRFIVTGTPGLRDWLANIRANPAVRIEASGLEVAGTAREVHDVEWKRAFFEASATSWYRTQAQLDDLVATAPMIEITDLRAVPYDAS